MSLDNPTFPNKSLSAINGEEELRRLVREQQETIRALRQTIETMGLQLKQQQERIEQLETELKTHKKLNKRPKITASRLNDSKSTGKEKSGQKRPGSGKV
ncbi:hypothetical protein, partial [Lyngbya confervoides]